MIALKNLAAVCAIACGLAFQAGNAAAVPATPPDFGNVAPPTFDQSIDVFRGSGPAPWYVHFNLQEEANVTLGVAELPNAANGSFFNITNAQLYDKDKVYIFPGTDNVEHNPFNEPVKYIISDLGHHPWGETGVHLAKGEYFLGVSGDGNRTTTPFPDTREYSPCCDLPDFRAHIQVMPVPEPETYALMLAGLGLVGFIARRRQRL